jgi:hypothetical protein
LATITSVKDGPWSEAATWGGTAPAAADTVNVRHVVTMDLNDSVTLFARINVEGAAVNAAYNGQLIFADGPRCICSTHYLRIDGGLLHMKPGSVAKFKTTSKSSSTEGKGLAGIYGYAARNGTKIIMEGSPPLPETTLTQNVALEDAVLPVSSASGFSPGEYIAVYYDISGDTTWGWDGHYISDEGFVIHHISGNNLYIQQRVAREDQLSAALPIGQNWATVDNARLWQANMTIWIDNELFTIVGVEDETNKLTFSAAATTAHAVDAWVIETGAQKEHLVGDKVAKLATVLTADAALGATQITVANASMINVGDRVAIEGNARLRTTVTEASVVTKNGNTLTLSIGLVTAASIGYIVIKTNRDCVVTGYDEAADTCRPIFYYTNGANTYTNRKCVLRYVEFARMGNSASARVYSGISIRSGFNRADTEAEMRGCSFRDSWSLSCGGISINSANYFHTRNNVLVNSSDGINAYSSEGSGVFNNISMAAYNYTFRWEESLMKSLFQYNIGLNSSYALYCTTNWDAYYPMWHNIFKHHTYGYYFGTSCISMQYGSMMKNRYENIYYRQAYLSGSRIVMQDIDCRTDKNVGWVNTNVGSKAADAEIRGLSGSLMVILNKDFIRGNFEIHGYGGIIEKDESMHMGNGWSYQFRSMLTTADVRINQMVQVQYGVPVTVVAYMRKATSYNGSILPRIVAFGRENGYYYQEMPNINNQWCRVELTFTPRRTELMNIGIGGRGSGPSIYWVDPRVVVSVPQADMVSGPASLYLMFGLEQIQSGAMTVLDSGIVLGSVD